MVAADEVTATAHHSGRSPSPQPLQGSREKSPKIQTPNHSALVSASVYKVRWLSWSRDGHTFYLNYWLLHHCGCRAVNSPLLESKTLRHCTVIHKSSADYGP